MTTIPPTTLPGDSTSWLPPVLPHGDHRTVFRGASWEAYQSLSQAQSEGEHVRLAYDGKDLEIVTTGNIHENLKILAGKFVHAVASWRGISHASFGEATLNAVNAKRGLQADHSYCFDPEKVRMARAALGRESTDPVDYPTPDLAIEIDMSPPQIDRPSIYAALNVPEVWRIIRGRRVIIEHLQPDGSYAPADASRFLPVSADEIHSWLTAEDVNQEEVWYCRLNQWAMGLRDRA